MMPFRPQLPPRAGYIEYDDNGVRRYNKVETDFEERISALEEESVLLKEKMTELEPIKTQLAELAPLVEATKTDSKG